MMKTIASLALTARPATGEDHEFLLSLYASTRAEEMKVFGWGPAQVEAFLKMQFTARQRSYQTEFPNAQYRLILKNEELIGQEIVDRDGRTVRLIDIALLPQFRGLGIGSLLLNELIEEARSKKVPVELKVLKNNRAARLYERLGFKKLNEDEMYFEMRIRPE